MVPAQSFETHVHSLSAARRAGIWLAGAGTQPVHVSRGARGRRRGLRGEGLVGGADDEVRAVGVEAEVGVSAVFIRHAPFLPGQNAVDGHSPFVASLAPNPQHQRLIGGLGGTWHQRGGDGQFDPAELPVHVEALDRHALELAGLLAQGLHQDFHPPRLLVPRFAPLFLSSGLGVLPTLVVLSFVVLDLSSSASDVRGAALRSLVRLDFRSLLPLGVLLWAESEDEGDSVDDGWLLPLVVDSEQKLVGHSFLPVWNRRERRRVMVCVFSVWI